MLPRDPMADLGPLVVVGERAYARRFGPSGYREGEAPDLELVPVAVEVARPVAVDELAKIAGSLRPCRGLAALLMESPTPAQMLADPEVRGALEGCGFDSFRDRDAVENVLFETPATIVWDRAKVRRLGPDEVAACLAAELERLRRVADNVDDVSDREIDLFPDAAAEAGSPAELIGGPLGSLVIAYFRRGLDKAPLDEVAAHFVTLARANAEASPVERLLTYAMRRVQRRGFA